LIGRRIALCMACVSAVALAQPLPRVAVLALADIPYATDALVQRLRDLGYVDGKTIALTFRDNWATFDRALPADASASTRAFVVLSSPVAFQVSSRFADYTLRHRVPAISPFRPFAQAGGLMSYGPHLELFFQRAPAMIDRILRGVRPADIAVEQPLNYDLVINRRTARALGLELPTGLLLRADEVIA
jgi:putative tryptophan/tyrosine transport system substrate-binding protein